MNLSRRGFLGMLGALAVAPLVKVPEPLATVPVVDPALDGIGFYDIADIAAALKRAYPPYANSFVNDKSPFRARLKRRK